MEKGFNFKLYLFTISDNGIIHYLFMECNAE